MRDNSIRAAAFAGGGWYAVAHGPPLLCVVAGAGVLVAVLALASTFSRDEDYREAAYETLELILDFLRPRPFSRSRSRSRPSRRRPAARGPRPRRRQNRIPANGFGSAERSADRGDQVGDVVPAGEEAE
jgi:hypothetical protein